MENVIERMERTKAKVRVQEFLIKEKLPYELKVKLAKRRAVEFITECGTRNLNCHVSVGGLDSITLLFPSEYSYRLPRNKRFLPRR